MTNTAPLNFESYRDRDDWIRDNAKYFTVVRHLGRGKYERVEKPTLQEAQETAGCMAQEAKRPYIIYAVTEGGHAAFVQSVMPTEEE